MRKVLVTSVAIVTLIGSQQAAMAVDPSSGGQRNWQELPFYEGRQLPGWLEGATPVDPSGAARVRGEQVPSLVYYYAVVYGIPASYAAAAWASRWKPGVISAVWQSAKNIRNFVRSLR